MMLQNRKAVWNRKPIWTKAVLSLCVLASGLMAGGAAQAADNSVTVGVLDESRLGKGFVKYASELEALNKRAGAYDTQLDAREVLTDVEGKRFDELIDKSNRTPAEETEFQGLVSAGGTRRKDRDALIGKAPRSTDEEARLKAIQANMKTNAAKVRSLEDTLFETLKTQENATNQKYIELANDMVKKVAVEKKLTVIFRKDAVVWFSPAVDITDEVLGRLNK